MNILLIFLAFIILLKSLEVIVLLILKRIYKRIALLNLDVIHVQTEFSMARLAIKCSKELNIPMVHTFHTLFDEYLSYVSGFLRVYFPKRCIIF